MPSSHVGPRSERPPDLLCLSHLRWNFVFQRPQHLMTRFARERRVLFVEEPIRDASERVPRMVVTRTPEDVLVVTPHLPVAVPPDAEPRLLRRMLDMVLEDHHVVQPVLWYYTPMAVAFTSDLPASTVVYDCMDELSLFRGAPRELVDRERELLDRADVVFTGGVSLWEAKRDQHRSVHPFPSSVDVEHFASARHPGHVPDEIAALPRPRAVFCGVIDERMDLELVDRVARALPAWQFAMIGPVVKMDPARLPQLPNVHWLGSRSYATLPEHLRACDAAIMPFALNEATRFISPTKTPEYLAAGLPVVSTPITDVVRPYGDRGLVRIADSAARFARELELCLERSPSWLAKVDALLATMSWDVTWSGMRGHLVRRPAVRRPHGDVFATT